MDDLCNEARPTALMGGTEAAACIAIEELVEPEVILPVLIEVEEIRLGIDGSTALVVAGEEMLHSVLEFLGDVAKVHVLARAGGTLDLERVAIEHVETEEGLDEQEVDAEPDRAAPVAVSTEERTVRLTGDVAHFECLAIDVHGVWVLFMVLGHGADAVL